MRSVAALFLALIAGTALGAEALPRYGQAPDLQNYPQATPQQALASVLKAVEDKRFDYLLAQLADPAFVDDRVKRLHGGSFEAAVEDSRQRLDPATVKLLGRFLKDGKWEERGDQAVARLELIQDRAVYLRRIDGRWFLEHRNKPN
jgi:hypothetical protein